MNKALDEMETRCDSRTSGITVDASDDTRASGQWHLDPAPDGIDARYAWQYEGGDGAGVSFVDVERGWGLPEEGAPFQHEDLPAIEVIHVADEAFPEPRHGAATLGVVLGVDNDRGIVGIAPNVWNPRVISISRRTAPDDYANTIRIALDQMLFGDVLLLEAQVSWRRHDGSWVLMPVEILEPVFDALILAQTLGVTVIEAAGNGGFDLDQFEEIAAPGRGRVLSATSPDFRDSGAILVGAATSSAPHQRIAQSNFGSRVDCFAWGEDVRTTRHYDSPWTPPDLRYTDGFNGTSSASAIVAGAALSLQGIAIASLGQALDPLTLRDLLKWYGTPTVPEDQGIGTMPDLRRTILEGLRLPPIDADVPSQPDSQAA